MILNYFALQYPNNKLLGIDSQSGGYPFETDNISSAFLLEAIPKNLSKFRELETTYKDQNVNLVVVCIKPLKLSK